MTIRVKCPNCSKGFKAPDESAGKSGECPNCRSKIVVPKAISINEAELANLERNPTSAVRTADPPCHKEISKGDMAKEWYMSKAGKKRGPMSLAKLKFFASKGRITRDDLVWRDGFKNWVAASEIKGLFKTPPDCGIPCEIEPYELEKPVEEGRCESKSQKMPRTEYEFLETSTGEIQSANTSQQKTFSVEVVCSHCTSMVKYETDGCGGEQECPVCGRSVFLPNRTSYEYDEEMCRKQRSVLQITGGWLF